MKEEKRGIMGLGYVRNKNFNDNGVNYLTVLNQMVGEEITAFDLNAFIDSDNCRIEYFDETGKPCEKDFAKELRFKLPYTTKTNNMPIYGIFERIGQPNNNFMGVTWESLSKYGKIHPNSIERLIELSGNKNISQENLYSFISRRVKYYNWAGYPESVDGTPFSAVNGTFIRFSTNLTTNENNPIYGWFTKNQRGQYYEGLNWGTEDDFKSYIRFIGKKQVLNNRIVFNTKNDYDNFLEELAKKTIKEPWRYKHKEDKTSKYPILKSYIEYELHRLYYEHEILGRPDKIIYNKGKSWIYFNTNLISKFGTDLYLVGRLSIIGGKECVSDLIISPDNKVLIRDMDFDLNDVNRDGVPEPPAFFDDINDIVFHSDWGIDRSQSRYEHIIEERRNRFPEKYRNMSVSELGRRLDEAINFAKRSAQRNYKFIAPMYYPKFDKIQLLMPIYLEPSYESSPDFALVLSPERDCKLYELGTILGLDEAYQDARLIAKPDESWLNPEKMEL